MEIIAQRSFALTDQQAFADWSGDYNPMHLDPVQARRTMAGAPVVHGVHALLWAYDTALHARPGLASFKAAQITFKRFIHLDQTVELAVSEDARGYRLEVRVDGEAAVIGKFRPASELARTTLEGSADLETIPLRSRPAEPDYDQMRSSRGWLEPGKDAVCAMSDAFPVAAAELSPDTVAACAQLSRLVGMVIPGLHSIFTTLSLEFASTGGERPGVGFAARQVEERYRLVKIDFAGAGLSGSLDAFVRPPPTQVAAPVYFDSLALKDTFADWRALVVGGSRGLGEVTAKLIAAGGGDVLLTYAAGAADADRVRRDINDHYGRSACRTARMDVTDDLSGQLSSLEIAPTHLFYFATPQIFPQKSAKFSAEMFHKFSHFYVIAFEQICAHVAEKSSQRLTVFYPSSIAVTDRPKGMTEYAMAKMAGEILCADLEILYPHMGIRTERLPRITTDQTATVAAAEAADPIAVMHPLLMDIA